MNANMDTSLQLDKAKALIQSVDGKELSPHERVEHSSSLAAWLLDVANALQTPSEKKRQREIAAMTSDSKTKQFVTALTDQCFRSEKNRRVANQLSYLIASLGVPPSLPWAQKLGLYALAIFGKAFSFIAVPLAIRMIRKKMGSVIFPGEKAALEKHIALRRKERVILNLNRLGEAILGEDEAERRIDTYLQDLANPDIEYISIKVSTLFSQINLLAWEETERQLKERLREIYRAANSHQYVRSNGRAVQKFVNLDMEEYRDLHLTVSLFREVLDEPEFRHLSAGIVLQSYLPDSFLIQQELTVWAMQRLANGGAPIKIRIVKGANLAMEQLDARLHLFAQAPYTSKADTDANYIRMINYGCQNAHAKAVHLGIATHNLFDISYALLLRAENRVEPYVCFEMLEGMIDHIRRALLQLNVGEAVVYCPVVKQKEFQNAVAYLTRRFDENSAPKNFLRVMFDLKVDSEAWKEQKKMFSEALLRANDVSYLPRRQQNRFTEKFEVQSLEQFQNEPDTDWALQQNRKWAEKIIDEWKNKIHAPIPLVIAGEVKTASPSADTAKRVGVGKDPSEPTNPLYHYALADGTLIELAISSAKAHEEVVREASPQERLNLLAHIAHQLRIGRKELIGAMVADVGKTVVEADAEVSEAIDFAEYYRLSYKRWASMEDIDWTPKGTVLVTSPWNFPVSIPAGGIIAALVTGNSVIFKPSREALLTGWTLAQIFWKAGVTRQALQFIACESEVGNILVKDPRVNTIVLTGSTETAKHFLRTRPGLDLMAETGGKNTIVVTAMADRDLSIKDIVQSAFGYAGQKCSACSLAILEAEVYDDPHYLQQLCDAAASLAVGSAWDMRTRVNPLICPPKKNLLRGLTELEEGESWLLEPKQIGENPHLFSPGIKMGVKPSSFTFQNELFGPVLGLVRARSFSDALSLMNQTKFGLTAGIHTLDNREKERWLAEIEAGNCYINRTITGAVVQRQPFGGCKESGYGKGAKAGGPNYITQFMHAKQIGMPLSQDLPNGDVQKLTQAAEKSNLFSKEMPLWKKSVGSYAFFWNIYFSRIGDLNHIAGQDNLHAYVPHADIVLRESEGDSLFNLLRVVAAALTCGSPLEISLRNHETEKTMRSLKIGKHFRLSHESDEAFVERIKKNEWSRCRLLKTPSPLIKQALAEAACNITADPVLANGRLELLTLLREVSISHDTHRYGYTETHSKGH